MTEHILSDPRYWTMQAYLAGLSHRLGEIQRERQQLASAFEPMSDHEWFARWLALRREQLHVMQERDSVLENMSQVLSFTTFPM